MSGRSGFAPGLQRLQLLFQLGDGVVLLLQPGVCLLAARLLLRHPLLQLSHPDLALAHLLVKLIDGSTVILDTGSRRLRAGRKGRQRQQTQRKQARHTQERQAIGHR